jgi:hypothetical protein
MIMLRAIFVSWGLFLAMSGGSLLLVDKMVLTFQDEPAEDATQDDEEFRGLFMGKSVDDRKVFDPPEWLAFSLMSVGTVTMLYAIALPKRRD